MLNEGLPCLTLAIACAYAVAAIAFLLKCLLPRLAGRWFGWAFMPAILACTLIVPADRIGLRAIAAFLVNEVAMKVVDYFRHDRPPNSREYASFLFPFPFLAVVFPDHKRRLAKPDDPWPHFVRLALGTIGVVAGFTFLKWTQNVAYLQS